MTVFVRNSGLSKLNYTLIVQTLKMTNISSVDLSAMRKPYSSKDEVFLESTLPTTDPLKLFHLWFDVIKTCGKVYEPNAVCLATSDKNGRPSARMVLLKSYGKDGFTVFTNYESRKAQEMTENPNASLLFYWSEYNRQVRVEGKVEKVSEEESIEYFKCRPKASQISARISEQSRVIESRDKLIERYKAEENRFGTQVPPKPDFWGGFRIIPEVYEFWCGQTDRLHDRIRFRKLGANQVVDGKLTKLGEEGWVYERIQP